MTSAPALTSASTVAVWLAPPPPPYLWTLPKRLPAGVRYLADRAAIDTVTLVLRRQGRDYP